MSDGEVKHVHATGRAVNIGNLESVGAVRDVTERKQAEEASRQALTDLARSNQVTTMGEFTASLAHEVNQPITGAILNAKTCLRWLDRNPLREVFDVGMIIRETVDLMRGEAARYNISVHTELAADLPKIVGDRVQLQQVAMNLIVNSIEATKDIDGIREMVIESQRAENEQILVSISDAGVGVPPQLAEHIFDPFFTTKSYGTGMGLRISRSIVESHGGRLCAANAPGRGAIFQFNLSATVPDRS